MLRWVPQLPEELLEQVFSTFINFERDEVGQYKIAYRTLSSICLASKAFNRIGVPLLYRKVYLGYRGCTTRLLRTLVRRPKLADLVRAVRFNGPACDQMDVYATRLDNLNLCWCRAYLMDSGLDATLRQSLMSGLQHEYQDAQCALILHMCQKVKVVDITAGYPSGVPDFHDTRVCKVFEQALLNYDPDLDPELHGVRRWEQRGFLHLQEVFVEHCYPYGYTKLEDLGCFLRLRSLRRFSGHMIEMGRPPWVGTTSLTHLQCTCSAFEDRDVRRILVHCPQLEIFSPEFRRDTGVRFRPLAYGIIGHALRKYGKNLRDITLSHLCVVGRPDRQVAGGCLGDLRTLQSLQRLNVTRQTLLGEENMPMPGVQFTVPKLVNILPCSIQVLEFSDCYDEHSHTALYEIQLRSLMTDLRFQKLHTIKTKSRTLECSPEMSYIDWIRDLYGPDFDYDFDFDGPEGTRPSVMASTWKRQTNAVSTARLVFCRDYLRFFLCAVSAVFQLKVIRSTL